MIKTKFKPNFIFELAVKSISTETKINENIIAYLGKFLVSHYFYKKQRNESESRKTKGNK